MSENNGTSQPVTLSRPPLQIGFVVEEMLKRLPKEYREELLTQMAASTKMLDRVRNELTMYYMDMSAQEGLEANGLDFLRGQIIGAQSLFYAMALHGTQFARGTHPLIMKPAAEEPGPLDM